jgi:hypothetical protein
MTFLERYNLEETWWRKVLIMEIFHLTMSRQDNSWTLGKTAENFNVSIGLVSENLRIAQASHGLLSTILNCDTRESALKMLPKGR